VADLHGRDKTGIDYRGRIHGKCNKETNGAICQPLQLGIFATVYQCELFAITVGTFWPQLARQSSSVRPTGPEPFVLLPSSQITGEIHKSLIRSHLKEYFGYA